MQTEAQGLCELIQHGETDRWLDQEASRRLTSNPVPTSALTARTPSFARQGTIDPQVGPEAHRCRPEVRARVVRVQKQETCFYCERGRESVCRHQRRIPGCQCLSPQPPSHAAHRNYTGWHHSNAAASPGTTLALRATPGNGTLQGEVPIPRWQLPLLLRWGPPGAQGSVAGAELRPCTRISALSRWPRFWRACWHG